MQGIAECLFLIFGRVFDPTPPSFEIFTKLTYLNVIEGNITCVLF